jgi:hypothetical protein
MLSRKLSRREALKTLGVLGGGLVFASAVQAQPAINDLKPTITDVTANFFHPANQVSIAATGSQTVQTDSLKTKPFTDIIVRWQTPRNIADTKKLELRVSNDSVAWTKWVTLSFEPVVALPTENFEDLWSGIIPTDESRFYQLRVTQMAGSSDTPLTVEGIQVHTIDTRMPDAEAPQPLQHAELGGGSVSMASVTNPRPSFVSRTQWGSPDGESAPKAPPWYQNATHLVVHHTADPNTLRTGETSWASRVRAIWSWHAISLGWGDIGYNWLIDPNGVIYAGRAGSTDLSRDAVGFHDTANFGSMGVSVIGTYTSVTPTTASQASLVNLLSWKASQRNINPIGNSVYYGCSISNFCKRYVEDSVVPNIAGHRQVTPGGTTCPGDAFFSLMPSIRQRVYERVRGSSDNGDLIIDELEAGFSSTGTWNESTSGYNGHCYWTYTTIVTDGIISENSATWRPNLPATDQYKLLVHIPQDYKLANRTTNARYQIQHADGTTRVIVDQNTTQGWVELGTFRFNAGTTGSVRLNDVTGEPFSARKVILFDAVRWVPLQSSPAVLVSATLKTSIVAVGEVVRVDFTVKNNSSVPIETQSPTGGNPSDPANGWVYEETACFSNNDPNFNFAKQEGRLRVTLGFTEDSAKVPLNCSAAEALYPWRWGLGRPLQPGEARTISGYVRFRTPGTYKLRANLVHEFIKYYGVDGNGTEINLGEVTVTPAKIYIPHILR